MTQPETMRAAVVTRYGAPDVIDLQTRPVPRCGPGDVLVRVMATTVSSGDARVRARRVPEGMGLLMRLALGWNAPRNPVLGTECSGVVESVGSAVTRFKPGDAVVAFAGVAMNTHAEYVRLPADGALALKPADLGWEEAAALLFGGTTAYHYLHRAAKVQPGERVLVLGASGAVGVAAVQLARAMGAEVTGVCSAANAALVAGLGATRVLDYGVEDFTRGDARWDVVLDCVGATDYARCRGVLAPGGRLVRVVCGLAGLIAAPFQGRRAGHRVLAGVADERPEDVAALVALAEAGRYRAVIDGVYPFARIADAHARADTGRKRGSVVLTLEHGA